MILSLISLLTIAGPCLISFSAIATLYLGTASDIPSRDISQRL